MKATYNSSTYLYLLHRNQTKKLFLWILMSYVHVYHMHAMLYRAVFCCMTDDAELVQFSASSWVTSSCDRQPGSVLALHQLATNLAHLSHTYSYVRMPLYRWGTGTFTSLNYNYNPGNFKVSTFSETDSKAKCCSCWEFWSEITPSLLHNWCRAKETIKQLRIKVKQCAKHLSTTTNNITSSNYMYSTIILH